MIIEGSKVMYTTNAIEPEQRLPSAEPWPHDLPQCHGPHQGVLPGDLGADEKWTMPVQNWGQVYAELDIMYPGRLTRN